MQYKAPCSRQLLLRRLKRLLLVLYLLHPCSRRQLLLHPCPLWLAS
jgi:hypothetical protein